MQVKTELGFGCEVEEDVLNDWEILECFQKIDKGESGLIIDVAEMLLGKEQYEALKAFIKERYGKVKADVMMAEIMSIFNSVKQAKNY